MWEKQCAEGNSNAQNVRHSIDEQTLGKNSYWKIAKNNNKERKIVDNVGSIAELRTRLFRHRFFRKKKFLFAAISNRRECPKRTSGVRIHSIVQQLLLFHIHTHTHSRVQVKSRALRKFICLSKRRHMHTHSTQLPYVRAIENGYSNRWRENLFFATNGNLSSNTELMKSMQALSIRLLNEIKIIHKKITTIKHIYLLGRQFTHIEFEDAFNSPRTAIHDQR